MRGLSVCVCLQLNEYAQASQQMAWNLGLAGSVDVRGSAFGS